MLNSSLHAQTKCQTDVVGPESRLFGSHVPHVFRHQEPLSVKLVPAARVLDIDSRKFVGQIVDKNASAVPGSDLSSRHGIDWEAVEASVAKAAQLNNPRTCCPCRSNVPSCARRDPTRRSTAVAQGPMTPSSRSAWSTTSRISEISTGTGRVAKGRNDLADPTAGSGTGDQLMLVRLYPVTEPGPAASVSDRCTEWFRKRSISEQRDLAGRGGVSAPRPHSILRRNPVIRLSQRDVRGPVHIQAGCLHPLSREQQVRRMVAPPAPTSPNSRPSARRRWRDVNVTTNPQARADPSSGMARTCRKRGCPARRNTSGNWRSLQYESGSSGQPGAPIPISFGGFGASVRSARRCS
jgi:hypothetical protein